MQDWVIICLQEGVLVRNFVRRSCFKKKGLLVWPENIQLFWVGPKTLLESNQLLLIEQTSLKLLLLYILHKSSKVYEEFIGSLSPIRCAISWKRTFGGAHTHTAPWPWLHISTICFYEGANGYTSLFCYSTSWKCSGLLNHLHEYRKSTWKQ